MAKSFWAIFPFYTLVGSQSLIAIYEGQLSHVPKRLSFFPFLRGLDYLGTCFGMGPFYYRARIFSFLWKTDSLVLIQHPLPYRGIVWTPRFCLGPAGR